MDREAAFQMDWRAEEEEIGIQVDVALFDSEDIHDPVETDRQEAARLALSPPDERRFFPMLQPAALNSRLRFSAQD